jgi:hypothetical protein
MDSTTKYEYADGSGNTYLLTPASLEYLPVTPETSSSGTYSGGEPRKVNVGELEFERLSNLMDRAINDSSTHQENREMMTGLVVRAGASGRTRVVLKRNSPVKSEIEKALKEILNK